MRVRVDRCDDEKQLVFGTLDNEPLNEYGGNLKLGSELAISYSQVRDQISKRSEEIIQTALPFKFHSTWTRISVNTLSSGVLLASFR